MDMNRVTEAGKLYVVATPIGNLADLSFRAVEVLKQVNIIAAEDTRHIKQLLNQYGIANKMYALHQYNEEKASAHILEKLREGLSVALVSDAGTPLLSDPGMPLVKMVKNAGLQVVPIPGACALIAALSVAGLPVSRFCFEGFSPRTASARKAFFSERANLPMTWVFYESSHRILASLTDMAEILPPERNIVVAREMTKMHETIIKAPLIEMLAKVTHDENMRKGEFVVIVDAAETAVETEVSVEQDALLKILLEECTIKTAVSLAAKITGVRKKTLYQRALTLQTDQ